MPIIIDFEGLDCSFKETNSKRLAEYLNGKRYEFPKYDSESSYFIRQYLAGKYNGIISTDTVMTIYLMEMFDIWHTQIMPDIRNGLEIIVLDRFWYSNYYYQCTTIEDKIKLQKLVSQMNLPNCNVLFKMLTNFDLTIKKIRSKKNKDILESDEERMRITYDRFNNCAFSKANNVVEIYTYDENGFRNKDDIFEDIKRNYEYLNLI